jgi:hypothetical protein
MVLLSARSNNELDASKLVKKYRVSSIQDSIRNILKKWKSM